MHDDDLSRSPRRDALAEEVITAIIDAVRAMPDSPQKRQLGAKAESYKRALEQWANAPPTTSQRNALRDMVLALHAKLVEVMRRSSLDLTPGTGIRHEAASHPLNAGNVNDTGALRRLRGRDPDDVE